MKFGVKRIRKFDDGIVSIAVTFEGHTYDCDVCGNGVEWTPGMPREIADAFCEAWPRYLAEKAKRSVVVSRETMRPMADAEMQQAIQWSSPDSALFKTDVGLRVCVIADLEGSTMPEGWWPLANLSPMPAEFDSWDT